MDKVQKTAFTDYNALSDPFRLQVLDDGVVLIWTKQIYTFYDFFTLCAQCEYTVGITKELLSPVAFSYANTVSFLSFLGCTEKPLLAIMSSQITTRLSISSMLNFSTCDWSTNICAIILYHHRILIFTSGFSSCPKCDCYKFQIRWWTNKKLCIHVYSNSNF
jgi:hypothetical protein